MTTFVDKIVKKLISLNLTLATCESITGGMIASNIINIPNVSKIYLGGLVTYSNATKIKLAHVNQNTIDKFGAISKETAIEMVKGTQDVLKSDIAIAITGNAGPRAYENKPIGLAYVAFIIIDKVNVFEIKSSAITRNEIRVDLTYQTLSLLEKILDNITHNVRS